MSKISTVRYIRQQLFKSDIDRIKFFFEFSDDEFNTLFIDGEPDGCLHGKFFCQGHTLQVQIYRNGQEPEFYCSKNKEYAKKVGERYKEKYPTRS